MAINGIYREVTMEKKVTFTSNKYPGYKIIWDHTINMIDVVVVDRSGGEIYKRVFTERKEDES